MTIHLIWAEARGGVIGADGGIPWRVPGEQATFRERTSGSTVVMGRATWDSLPSRFRPLPGRRNVVLTRDRGWSAPGAEVAHAVDEVLARGEEHLWVMGGGAIYAAFLPYAAHIVRTEIDLDVPGDTHAPVLGPEWPASPAEWQISDNGVKWRVVEHFRTEAPRSR